MISDILQPLPAKEDVSFGHGSWVGRFGNNENFQQLDPYEQAKYLGWVAGCPVVLELIDLGNTEAGRGAEAMVERYAQVNFWFGEIQRRVEGIKPELGHELIKPEHRNGQPRGKHEAQSVPEVNKHFIPPMGRLAGYGLSRVMIEQLGRKPDISKDEAQERLVKGLSELEAATTEADSPLELLAIFAEKIATRGDVPQISVLKHILPRGWQEEHNDIHTLKAFKAIMEEKAPHLWGTYKNMTDAQKFTLGLVR